MSGGFQDATYTRDAIGNVTTITDAVTATKECFLCDTRNRLIRAHTAATSSACATDPTAAFTGSRGSDPYDLQWTFDAINRIDTKIDMLPAGAGTLDYQYGDSAHPHAVTGMTDAGGVTLTNYGYSYNPVGAMTSRKSNTAAADTLAYDPSQRLTSYDRATGTDETYQYWAINQRVVRQAGTTRTVYLPGLDITIQGATLTITKQITAGTVVATKTIVGATTSIYWNCADLQNSTTCQTPAGSAPATPTIRHYSPYGTPRNTNTHPNTTRGYLNQPEDPTGLTYLNNRYHDPTLGAFVSVDPLVGTTGTPYLYTSGNPVAWSDPSGLCRQGNAYASWDDHKPCKADEKIAAALEQSESNAELMEAWWGQECGAGIGQAWSCWDSGIPAYPEDEGLLELGQLFQIGPEDAARLVLCGSDVQCQVDVLHGSRDDIDGPSLEPIDQEVMDDVLVWAGVQQVDACGTSSSGAVIYCAAVSRLPSKRSSATAITQGHFILYDVTERNYLMPDGTFSLPAMRPETFAHELAHVEQWEGHGSGFLWRYLATPRTWECHANAMSHTSAGRC